MPAPNLFRTKIIDRIRQYGFHKGFTQIFLATLRWAYRIDRDIIFVIPDFAGHVFCDSCIKPLDSDRLRQAVKDGEMEDNEVRLLSEFIAEGCKGLYAEIGGKLAGYGFIQYRGVYCFGRFGRMNIPPNYVVLKNLYIVPEFRGLKLAQKINAARLAHIPPDKTPVTFIIPENRFAIRNWEKYGFKRILKVTFRRWFRGRWQMHIERLADCLQADQLEKELSEAFRNR